MLGSTGLEERTSRVEAAGAFQTAGFQLVQPLIESDFSGPCCKAMGIVSVAAGLFRVPRTDGPSCWAPFSLLKTTHAKQRTKRWTFSGQGATDCHQAGAACSW